MKKKTGIGKVLLGIGLGVVLIVAAVNRQTIVDFVLGRLYTPSVEMLEIREKLGLTSQGELIFNASRPELNDEYSFNQNCRSHNEEESILGCYIGRRIFVYHIKDNRLDGILELTVAHELLHAVYERMPASKKDDLRNLVEEVYKENLAFLEGEINSYSSEEQLEEIYVRVGTEVKDLPDELEKHFAEIFRDQDRIVSFYESYIRVFREIENEFRALEAEMNELNVQIDAKTAEYERGVSGLNREIDEFNQCANTAGCFKSDIEFSSKRNELLGRRNELRTLYEEIDRLIEKYNADVVRYNNNVVRNENLQNIVNSHVRVEGL